MPAFDLLPRTLLTSMVALLLPLSVWAQGKVRIMVELNPAGSFVAESSAVKGAATRTGNVLIAQNITLDLSSLKTGVSLRDQHMKDKYFEVRQFPQAVLIQGTAKDGKFSGDLTIHGVSKKIEGSSSIDGSLVKTKFKCALSDFGIKPASYMGVGVEDEVEVEATLPIAAALKPTSPKPAATPQKK